MGVELLLVSGMGPGAQRRMEAAGVRVHAGVAPGDPQELLRLWLDGGLPAAPNRCGHDGTAHHAHAHDHAETGGPHARGGCGCAH
jgi:predicted Fe-Mo cluster-binding NifX family protein